MKFVCEDCKAQNHVVCPGSGHCDCQHREPSPDGVIPRS